MKNPEHTHYLILLKNGRYLCLENSNTACVYHHTDHQTMTYDLNTSGGELVALTPQRESEIFLGINYGNERKNIEAWELREELRGLSNYTNTLETYQDAS